MSETLSNKQKGLLMLQQVFAFISFPLLFGVLCLWMKYYQGYKIRDIKAIRRQFKALSQQVDGPLLICPNHLTFIDSLILMWAFSSPWQYLCYFKRFAWNLPKRSHVAESLLYRGICYLGKCLLISNEKNESKSSMKKSLYLLQNKHYVMIFPEGTRSKTGRINTETYVYGVGGLVAQTPNLAVLMVYLRGDKQAACTKMPERVDDFSISMKLMHPNTSQKGLRGARDISRQLIEQLCKMEADYFAHHNR